MTNKLYTHENLAQFIFEFAQTEKTPDESEMIFVSRELVNHIRNLDMIDGTLIFEIQRQIQHYSLDYTAADAARVLQILKNLVSQTPA